MLKCHIRKLTFMSSPPFERMITFTKIVVPTIEEVQFIPQSGRTSMFIRNLLIEKIILLKSGYFNNWCSH
jgi:hypothetical protein